MFTPDYASATSLLSHLNSEELKELLNDESKLEIMIKDLEQMKQVEAEKEMIIASNKSLAEYNLALKPELEQSRQDLAAQYQVASVLKVSVQTLRNQMGGRKCQRDLETVLALLQAATAQAEESSELLFEDLENKKTSIDKFLQDFLKERTHVHLLRTKCDKMAALLPGGVYKSPPEKPRRVKKAPPPPAHIKPVNQVSGIYPVVLKPNTDPIIPTRVAPNPPVVIPRRHMNSTHSGFSVIDQSAIKFPHANLPCTSNIASPPMPAICKALKP